MFVTAERVHQLTRFEVDLADIHIAQGVIETYIGRNEATVTDADDLAALERATAYQAAYMKNDDNNVFEQASVLSLTQDNASVDYRANDWTSPFVAPLAVMALRHLSWKKSRSIHTGGTELKRRRFLDWKRD